MKRRGFLTKIEISPAFVLLISAFYISDMLPIYFLALICGIWHEMGHLLAMKILKNKAQAIRVTPFGIKILKCENQFFSYQKDIFIYLAGPLFNLLASVIFYLVFYYQLWWSQIMAYLVGINLVLFLFNLIPVFTLDGGRILLSVFLLVTSYHRAYKIMNIVSWCCIVLLLITGAFVLLLTQYNITLLLAGVYLATTMKKQ